MLTSHKHIFPVRRTPKPLTTYQNSERLNPSQQPLQMAIRASGLELRLHVTGEIGLSPHEATFEMLHAHDALVVAEALEAARHEDILVHQIGESDDDGFVWFVLEPHLPVPGHVLDREHCAVRQEVQVQCAVGSIWVGMSAWKYPTTTKL